MLIKISYRIEMHYSYEIINVSSQLTLINVLHLKEHVYPENTFHK